MIKFARNKTRVVNIGSCKIGGGSDILVQSMTNTDTRDVVSTIRQIKELEVLGCELVRVAVPDMESAKALGKIKKAMSVPLAADIHFDHRLALEAISQGVDKLRINPGNIGSKEKVKAVVEAAKERNIPIRIGVNAGSLKDRHAKTSRSKAQRLVDSAMEHVKILEDLDFEDIVVSLKASDVLTTIEAYKIFADKRNYPLHIGITESGTLFRGTIKSSAGIGILLYLGLGDTLRVSLTSDPQEEVKVAYQILQSLGLRSTGIELISCPTCSRCEVDLVKITQELEDKLSGIDLHVHKFSKKPLRVAVMGCVVNGPGEAEESDIGIAGGKNTGLFFRNGKPAGQVVPSKWVEKLIQEIKGRVKNE